MEVDFTSREYYMQEALKEAHKAFESNEVPVGAIIVYKEKIIARAHNQIRLLKDPTAHAEILAITQAADYLKNERLINCSLYATLEPCAMCFGAMILARIKNLYFGAFDSKAGACGSKVNLPQISFNHRINIYSGYQKDKSELMLKEFFLNKRLNKLKKE